jgi:putative SOS response-associated peptidase YedK
MLAAIHNDKKRMPAILTDQEALRWLEPAGTQEKLQELLQPHEIPDLTAHPVSRLVGSHTQERNMATIQDSFDYPELGEMSAITG